MQASREEDSPVQREIDANLKRIFDETAQEPLPQKLTDLIGKLREQSSTKKGES